MKKVVFGLVATVIITTLCSSQTKDDLMKRFMESKESSVILENISKYGSFNQDDCVYYSRNINDDKVYFTNYKIVDKEETVGYLQIVQDDKYLYNQFVYLKNYNLEKKSGLVDFYDLLKNQKILTVTVENDKINPLGVII